MNGVVIKDKVYEVFEVIQQNENTITLKVGKPVDVKKIERGTKEVDFINNAKSRLFEYYPSKFAEQILSVVQGEI